MRRSIPQGRLCHIGELGKCLGRQNLWGGKIGPKFFIFITTNQWKKFEIQFRRRKIFSIERSKFSIRFSLQCAKFGKRLFFCGDYYSFFFIESVHFSVFLHTRHVSRLVCSDTVVSTYLDTPLNPRSSFTPTMAAWFERIILKSLTSSYSNAYQSCSTVAQWWLGLNCNLARSTSLPLA